MISWQTFVSYRVLMFPEVYMSKRAGEVSSECYRWPLLIIDNRVHTFVTIWWDQSRASSLSGWALCCCARRCQARTRSLFRSSCHVFAATFHCQWMHVFPTNRIMYLCNTVLIQLSKNEANKSAEGILQIWPNSVVHTSAKLTGKGR